MVSVFHTRQVALGLCLSIRVHVLQGGTQQVLARVEGILQSRPFGVYLLTAWRTLSKSFLECCGPDNLDNYSFF